MGVNRKLSGRLIAAVAALIAVVVSVVPAAAEPDDDGYLAILHRAGVKGSDATLLTLGNDVCDQFHAGAGFDAVTASIWENSAYQAFQAGMIVEAAKQHLCPDVYDLPTAS